MLTLRVLGPLVVEQGGVACTLKSTKAGALLAYLACNSQRHTRSHLVGLLWPTVDEERGLASLRSMLWELQRLLGVGWVEASRAGVQLCPEPAVWVDLGPFRRLLKEAAAAQGSPAAQEALRGAVELYRGRLLEGLSLPDCAAFDEWRMMAEQGLHTLATQALTQLCSGLVSAGLLSQALPHCQRLVALDATNEDAQCMLIRLYAWLQRWSDALRQHQLCVTRLREDLDLAPQAETLRLLEALKTRSLAPPPSPAAVGVQAARQDAEQAPCAAALPAPATPLFGRQHELRQLLGRLEDPACRLLTLTGPGGIGKTRLALEAAHHHQARAPRQQVRLVCLDSVDTPASFATALLEALQLPASQAPAAVQLREHLRARQLVLVLDNLEHLLEVTPLLAELLACAPGLKLLVTSRERLNLRGEWLLRLEGLAYPGPQGPHPETEREALELFALLAARAAGSFQLTADTEPAVARICQLVDGSPLGLELAAAWVPFFSAPELASRLEQDPDFLSASRDAPGRHQSLRATFLHSWRLLSAEEQGVLRRLSVFRSDMSLEAAGTVAGASLELISSLVHKSLLRRPVSGRVQWHGLLRKYAEEQLQAVPAEAHQTHQRHAEYFLGLISPLHVPLRQGAERQAAALATFEREQEELRAALRWAWHHARWELLAQSLEAYGLAQELRARFLEASAELLAAISALRPWVDPKVASAQRRLLGRLLVWQARCALCAATSPSSALALLEEALVLLGAEGASEDVISGLFTAGQLTLRQGNGPTARWCFHGSLSLARAQGNRRAVALALSELSEVAHHRGRPEQARQLLARSLATFRLLGDERNVASCLGRLASLWHARGELDKAAHCLHQGMSLLESSGLRLQAASLRAQLAQVLLDQSQGPQAQLAHEANLRLGQTLGHPETVALAFQGLGAVAAARQERAVARQLMAQALELLQQLGMRRALGECHLALGQLALDEALLPHARVHLRAALRAATEASCVPLLLHVLVTLVQLPVAEGESESMSRAVHALRAHPLTPYAARQRALGLPAPSTPLVSPRPVLQKLVEDVLAAVGMA